MRPLQEIVKAYVAEMVRKQVIRESVMRGKKFPLQTLPISQIVLKMFKDKKNTFFNNLLQDTQGMSESETEAYMMFRIIEKKLLDFTCDTCEDEWSEPLQRL